MAKANGESVFLDQAELQSLGDAIIRASYNLETYPDSYQVESFPTLRMLAKACLTNIWEQREQLNRLRERLSNRDQQISVVEEKTVSQD